MGRVDALLTARSLWVCLSCQTCTTRCPNGIDIAGAIDLLKTKAMRTASAADDENAPQFHKAFLEDLRKRGRINEITMILRYKLKSGKLTDDVGLGVRMASKGKLRILSNRVSAMKEIDRIFKRGKDA